MLPQQTQVSGLLERIYTLGEGIGPTGRLAALTVLASLVGSSTRSIIADRALDWFERILGMPDWEAFIAESVKKVRRYEEYEVRFRQGEPQSYRVTSSVVARHMYADVEDREQARDNTRFRLAMFPLLLAPTLSLAAVGGWRWLILLVLPMLSLLDSLFIAGRTDRYMTDARKADVNERIKSLTTFLAKPDMDDKHRAVCEQDLFDLRAELGQLNRHRFRRQNKPQSDAAAS